MFPIRRLYTEMFCDLYGTIFDIRCDEDNPVVWDKMCAYVNKHGAQFTNGSELFATYNAQMNKAHTIGVSQVGEHVEVDFVPVWKTVYAVGGAVVDDTVAYDTASYFHRESTIILRPYPHAKEFLRLLKTHMKISPILVSNAQAAFTIPDLKKHGLDELFDKIFISSDFGIKKPDKRFFNYALQRCNTERSHVVYLGNEIGCDIEGATGAGIDAVYLHTLLSIKGDPDHSPLAVLNVEGPDYDAVLSWLAGKPVTIEGEGESARIGNVQTAPRISG